MKGQPAAKKAVGHQTAAGFSLTREICSVRVDR